MNNATIVSNDLDRSPACRSQAAIKCRCCSKSLQHLVVDLGLSPLCESLVYADQLNEPETFYPLRVYVCDQCWLVQLHDHVSGREIFDDAYAYASSMSTTWLSHCERYTEQIAGRLALDKKSLVLEIASNDGYLLKNFVKRGIPCLGIEPASRLATAARLQGIQVRDEYFGCELAQALAAEGMEADLMIGNNVLAHVPDLHDFIGGFKRILKKDGTITFEFHHLLNLIEQNQFDTIYQEHYCYFSIIALQQAFAMHDLRIYDVEQLPTHGGSLRIYVCHSQSAIETLPATAHIVQRERAAGLNGLQVFQAYSELVSETKWKLLEFLIAARRAGKRVAGYGAPGKGNTLLNYCGIREDLVQFTVDRNPLKQNSYLVGSRIPVYEPSAIDRERPDYILILPWNLRDEIVQQLSYARQWGAKFIVPIPQLEVIS